MKGSSTADSKMVICMHVVNLSFSMGDRWPHAVPLSHASQIQVPRLESAAEMNRALSSSQATQAPNKFEICF